MGIVTKNPNKYKIVGLVAGSNAILLLTSIKVLDEEETVLLEVYNQHPVWSNQGFHLSLNYYCCWWPFPKLRIVGLTARDYLGWSICNISLVFAYEQLLLLFQREMFQI